MEDDYTFEITGANDAVTTRGNDAVYRLMILMITIFFIRTMVTASLFHYIFNATMPNVLRSMIGKSYDRDSFQRLPFSTAFLLVTMGLVLFPSR